MQREGERGSGFFAVKKAAAGKSARRRESVSEKRVRDGL